MRPATSRARYVAVAATAAVIAGALATGSSANAAQGASGPDRSSTAPTIAANGGRAPGAYVPLSPARLLDTRTGVGASGPVRAHSTVHLQVTGRGGVPAHAADVSAVVLNVTVTRPTASGYVTAYPDGTARPTASNLNYVPGQTVANLVTVKLGANGKVALTSTSGGTVQLVADVSGYYVGGAATEPGTFVAVAPTRVLDTRTGLGVARAIGPHQTVSLTIAGAGGIPPTTAPTTARSVVLNLTATGPSRSGYLTAYPDGATRPTVSTLNFARRQTVPNLATVALPDTGVIRLYNGSGGTVHVVADLAGYYLSGGWLFAPPMGSFVPAPPQRLIDTRADLGAAGPVAANGTIRVPVADLTPWTGFGSVGAVVLNVTVTRPRTAGYLTAYPGGTPRPTASSLNFRAGQTVPNMVIAAVGPDGEVDISNRSGGTAEILVDLAGFITFKNGVGTTGNTVAVGDLQSCAVTADGGVACWGDNSRGQIWPSEPPQATTPYNVFPGPGPYAVTASGMTSCAFWADGDVSGQIVCWGDNSGGQFGDGSTRSGASSGVTTSAPWVGDTLGDGFACGLDSAGGVWCWGENAHGQLGDGTTTRHLAPALVPSLTAGVVALSAGDSHVCALTQLGNVLCWGENSHGQLGDGLTTTATTPVPVSGLAGVTAISAGHAHTCAVVADGDVRCWGDNEQGEIGTGNAHADPPADALTPVGVSGLDRPATDVAAGGEHTCALLDDGSIACWGDNAEGQLGIGTLDSPQPQPQPVSDLAGPATAVDTGPHHTCARLADRTVQCWGADGSGQLGNGRTAAVRSPVQVDGLTSGATALSAGQTGCVVVDGVLSCWGRGDTGALGDGGWLDASTPAPATGLAGDVVSVSTGGGHTCAVTAVSATVSTDRALQCWGENANGELGNGTTTASATPVEVTGLTSGAGAVSAGSGFTCALRSTGAVMCWGDNGSGQLGNGTTIASATPVQVSGLVHGATAVSAGGSFACAVLGDGSVSCWGANADGQLGNGSTSPSSIPVSVGGLPGPAVSVSAGAAHACAVTADGAAYCWGSNVSGRLGTGVSGGRSLTAHLVTGLTSGVSAVAAGGRHSCAVVSGALECWGANTAGQLGIGSSDLLSASPRAVDGLTAGVTDVSVGGDNSCAVGSGAVRCWGSRAYGAVGDGTSLVDPTPVTVLGF